MEMGIRQFVLIGISIFEVWLCYQFLFCTIIKKEYLSIKDKIIMWLSILIIGNLLGRDRILFFFSQIMFTIVFVLTSFGGYIIKKKREYFNSRSSIELLFISWIVRLFWGLY